MATREPRSTTRKRVLDAAATEFARNGIDGTSMSDIAERANLTKGAIYSNFDSKDDLVFALVREYSTPLDISAFLDPTLSFEQQLRELGRAAARTLRGASRRQVLLDRALQSYLLGRPQAMARYRKQFREVAETGGRWVEELAKSRGIDLGIPGRQFVTVVSALIRGMLEAALQDPVLLDEDYFADAFALLAPKRSGPAFPR